MNAFEFGAKIGNMIKVAVGADPGSIGSFQPIQQPMARPTMTQMPAKPAPVAAPVVTGTAAPVAAPKYRPVRANSLVEKRLHYDMHNHAPDARPAFDPAAGRAWLEKYHKNSVPNLPQYTDEDVYHETLNRATVGSRPANAAQRAWFTQHPEHIKVTPILRPAQ